MAKRPTKDKKREALRALVAKWSEKIRVEPRVVRVQRMTRKWGSCSTNGVVTLSDELSSRPVNFQEYVIAHELLHLRVKNHGKLFRASMGAYFPGWKEQDLQR